MNNSVSFCKTVLDNNLFILHIKIYENIISKRTKNAFFTTHMNPNTLAVLLILDQIMTNKTSYF